MALEIRTEEGWAAVVAETGCRRVVEFGFGEDRDQTLKRIYSVDVLVEDGVAVIGVDWAIGLRRFRSLRGHRSLSDC